MILKNTNAIWIAILVILLINLSGCNSYRQNIMFSTETDVIPDNVQRAVFEAEKNYIISRNDFLNIEVYTNGGERIIDPDFELLKETGVQLNQQLNKPTPNFLVQEDGLVRLPMIGLVDLVGLNLRQANIILQEKYSEFYENPFVITKYINKRVVILGATESFVVPLENENMSLIEVLAVAGGLGKDAKAHNIRLIRGNLTNPEVYLIDLSSINSMASSMVKILPGDIIYVEPVRRPLTEVVRDIAPILSTVTSGIALVIALRTL